MRTQLCAPQVCAPNCAHPSMCTPSIHTQVCAHKYAYPKYVHTSMCVLSYYLSAFAAVLGLELLPLGNAVVFFLFFLGGVSFRKQVQAPLVDTSDCWLPFSRLRWPDLSPLTMSPEPSCCFSLGHGRVKALQLCVYTQRDSDTLRTSANHLSSSSVGRDNGKGLSAQLGRGQEPNATVMDTLTSRWYQDGISVFPPFLRTGRKTEAGWGGSMGSQV